jgi:hypothetical protein
MLSRDCDGCQTRCFGLFHATENKQNQLSNAPREAGVAHHITLDPPVAKPTYKNEHQSFSATGHVFWESWILT